MGSTPSRLASSTSFSIARWVSRASVGCAIAFSCTVVSIATRSRSLVSIAPVRWATERLSCNSAAICSSPSRWRQRVSDERSNGSSCRNTTSPQKYWKYGFSTHRSHSASSERLCICLRMNSPATSRVGNGGCPGPIRHTELKRPARKSQSISPASRTSGWRRLMISSSGGRNRSSWRSSRGWLIGLPRQRISPSKESRTAHIGNPKPQENPHAHPAFLQNRLLAQIKSSRSINRFRILHGRLLEVADDGFDGGAPAHLAADGLGDTPDLAADPDLEPVRIVVAAIALVAVDAADRDTCKLFEIGDDGAESVAIIWVAVQRLGVKHELPALGRGDRSGN